MKTPLSNMMYGGCVTETIVREHESIDEALRRFKRECERAGIMQEIKKREYYESPSMKRKRKLSEMARKDRKQKSKNTFQYRKRLTYSHPISRVVA